MKNEKDIFDGVVGGGTLSADRTRNDICEPQNLVLSSPLDKRLAQLLTLHPQLRVKFRNNNLASLDDATKLALLEDMQEILGITPLLNG